MFKKIISVLVAFCLCFGLTACNFEGINNTLSSSSNYWDYQTSSETDLFDDNDYDDYDDYFYEDEEPSSQPEILGEPEISSKPKPTVTSTKKTTYTQTSSKKKTSTVTVPKKEETTGNLVWVPTNGGKKYHSKSSCSNMKNPMQVSKETAVSNGFGPCGRCY